MHLSYKGSRGSRTYALCIDTYIHYTLYGIIYLLLWIITEIKPVNYTSGNVSISGKLHASKYIAIFAFNKAPVLSSLYACHARKPKTFPKMYPKMHSIPKALYIHIYLFIYLVIDFKYCCRYSEVHVLSDLHATDRSGYYSYYIYM